MCSLKVIITLLVCYACPLSGKVYFVSENFLNVLHWDPVKPDSSEKKVLYSVQYKRDTEEHFQEKEECYNITARSCDLTAETPSIYDIQYLARVIVNGSCHGKTTRFKPLAETVFGPPKLSVDTTVSSLSVNVTLPKGPNGVSIADIINRSTTGHSRNVIIYILKITKPEWAAREEKNTNGRFEVRVSKQLNQKGYCGHVVYKLLAEYGRPESHNTSFCVPHTDDHRMLLLWLLISAALLTATIIMLVVCMYKYVKGGKHNSMPQSLVTTSGTLHKVLQPQDRKLIFSEPVLCSQEKTEYAKIQQKPTVPSVLTGGYTPQDNKLQDRTGSSVDTDERSPNPSPQHTSCQSSEIYSVVVHAPPEKNINNNFKQDTSENTRTSNPPLSSSSKSCNDGGISPVQATLHDLDATESKEAMTLLLHTVRNSRGQLVLSSLFSQLQSIKSDEQSPLHSERKPLLSDLIDTNKEGPSLASLQSFDSSEWSDSGCDDGTVDTPTLSPSQPPVPDFHEECLNRPSSDAIFQSGYKKTWLPTTLLGNADKDSGEYKRRNYP